MKSKRVDVGAIRREQIVAAAVEIIAEQGLQELSLSRIEKKARMSRGQLTYYFRTKEDILLAVFDRLVELMHERIRQQQEAKGTLTCTGDIWDVLDHLLRHVLRAPDTHPEFHALQYTFLSQLGHRADFRERLASLYEEWRSGMAVMLTAQLADHPELRHVPPRALASLIQAILHGLAVQVVADPRAFEPEAMVTLGLDVLGAFLGRKAVSNGAKTRPTRNGKHQNKPVPSQRHSRISGE
jgi:AcrR family transcriptional regulator